MITEDSDYEVKCTESIDLALKMADSFPADVLLVDQGLDTGTKGVQGLDSLKKCYPKHAKFIIFTNYGIEDVERQAHEGGYFDNMKYVDDVWNKLDIGNSIVDKITSLLKK